MLHPLLTESAENVRDPQALPTEAERVLELLLAELPTKSAVRLAAQITGAVRKP